MKPQASMNFPSVSLARQGGGSPTALWAKAMTCSVNIKQDYLDDLRVPVEARQ